MAVLYSRVKRTVTTGATPGQKYLAVLFAPSSIDEDQIAEEIAAATSLAKGDVKNALTSLCEVIQRYNANSVRVKLGSLGVFSPKIKSKAKATLDEVTDDTIVRITTKFRPNPQFTKTMKSAGVRLRQADNKGYQDPNA